MTASERLYAADLAEQMVPGLCAELIVGQLALAGQLAEGLRLDDHASPPGLGAERAVALGGAHAQIDIDLIADCSAVATSDVRFLHRRSSNVL
jgi:hypothetical protein